MKECSICKAPILVGRKQSWLPCCHVFHEECIQRWTSINPSCPVCRHDLTSEQALPERGFEPALPEIAPTRESQHLFSITDVIRQERGFEPALPELLSIFYSPNQIEALLYYSTLGEEDDDDARSAAEDTILGEVVFEPSQIT
jgi:hypothetical protein